VVAAAGLAAGAARLFPVRHPLPGRGAGADIHDVGFRMTVTPNAELPDSWAAGQGIPGQRP
jgi:hypothetical protein